MAIRRCPDCGTINRPTAAFCDCGYVFDLVAAQAMAPQLAHDRGDHNDESLEDRRHLHSYQLTTGWLMVVGFVLICAASVATIAAGIGIAILPAGGSFVMLAKGIRNISLGMRGRDELAKLDARLPKARLVSG